MQTLTDESISEEMPYFTQTSPEIPLTLTARCDQSQQEGYDESPRKANPNENATSASRTQQQQQQQQQCTVTCKLTG